MVKKKTFLRNTTFCTCLGSGAGFLSSRLGHSQIPKVRCWCVRKVKLWVGGSKFLVGEESKVVVGEGNAGRNFSSFENILNNRYF